MAAATYRRRFSDAMETTAPDARRPGSVQIYLPRAMDAAAPASTAVARTETVGGAYILVVDDDPDIGNRCAQAAATYGATVVTPGEIYAQHVEVFAPAALGSVLNDATIPCLRCRIVCGGANNQLAEAQHDAALAARGIVFVPDYLANAGGVIDFHQETIDDQPDAVLAAVACIGTITGDVLHHAISSSATPLSVADRIVKARIRRR